MALAASVLLAFLAGSVMAVVEALADRRSVRSAAPSFPGKGSRTPQERKSR